MIEKLNSSGYLKSCPCPKPQINFKGEEESPAVNNQPESDTFEKEGMSTGAKVGVGAGALLGLAAIGFVL